MTTVRMIGVMLLALAGAAGCAGTGGPHVGVEAPQAAQAAPVRVEPSQIFNDVTQSP